MVRTIAIWVCCLILFLPSFGAAVWLTARHVDDLCRFRPVDAKITGSTIYDGAGRGLNYRLAISYRYEVDGKTYSSCRFNRVEWAHETPDWKRSIAARFPEGSTQTAYYDPLDPSFSLLRRELPWLSVLFLLAASSVPVFILFAFYRWFRKPQHRSLSGPAS